MRIGGAHVVGLDRTGKPAGECARQDGRFRFQIGQRISQRCIGARFRTTEESGADLDRARAQSQCGGDPSPVGDATRSDNRNRQVIGQAWQRQLRRPKLGALLEAFCNLFPTQRNGKVLFAFRRIFLIAVR